MDAGERSAARWIRRRVERTVANIRKNRAGYGCVVHFAARLLAGDVPDVRLLQVSPLHDAQNDVDGRALLIDLEFHAVDRLLLWRGCGLVALPDTGEIDGRLRGGGECEDKWQDSGFVHPRSVGRVMRGCNEFGTGAPAGGLKAMPQGTDTESPNF